MEERSAEYWKKWGLKDPKTTEIRLDPVIHKITRAEFREDGTVLLHLEE